MRFLITKFMLVNVGTKWEKENMPLQIKNSNSVKRNEKNSDKLSFIHIIIRMPLKSDVIGDLELKLHQFYTITPY